MVLILLVLRILLLVLILLVLRILLLVLILLFLGILLLVLILLVLGILLLVLILLVLGILLFVLILLVLGILLLLLFQSLNFFFQLFNKLFNAGEIGAGRLESGLDTEGIPVGRNVGFQPVDNRLQFFRPGRHRRTRIICRGFVKGAEFFQCSAGVDVTQLVKRGSLQLLIFIQQGEGERFSGLIRFFVQPIQPELVMPDIFRGRRSLCFLLAAETCQQQPGGELRCFPCRTGKDSKEYQQ